MKRLVTTLAAIALATPSIAYAKPAAQALSLSNAAVQPLRASAPMARKKLNAENEDLILGLAAAGIVVVVTCIAWWCDGNNDGDS